MLAAGIFSHNPSCCPPTSPVSRSAGASLATLSPYGPILFSRPSSRAHSPLPLSPFRSPTDVSGPGFLAVHSGAVAATVACHKARTGSGSDVAAPTADAAGVTAPRATSSTGYSSMRCSKRWTFPRPAPSSHSQKKGKKKKASNCSR